jgi:hypothetical protein
VSGAAGIPNGTTVSAHGAITVTLSANVTADVAAGTTLYFTSMTAAFTPGVTVTGGTSGATGIARRVLTTSINVSDVSGTFVSGEVITGPSSATATLQSAPEDQQLDAQYQHEVGWDKTIGQDTVAIESSFTSRNFGFAVGAPFEDSDKTLDQMTRIMRFEPDFNQVGALTVDVEGRSFAQDDVTVLSSHTFTGSDGIVDMVDQARILRLKVTSNVLGGFYEQGQVMVKLEPGDERATKLV